jgi:hypothetical protein
MDKNALRAMLSSKTSEYQKEVVVYAGNPTPERKNAIPRSRNYRTEEYNKYLAEIGVSK